MSSSLLDVSKEIFGSGGDRAARFGGSTGNNSTMRYGTAQDDMHDNKLAVLLDGSDDPIVAECNESVKKGQRVTVVNGGGTYKVLCLADGTIGGNMISADNAFFDKMFANEAFVGKLFADQAFVGHLEADYAKIDALEANYAKIDTLEAQSAKIENLEATKASIDHLEANYAHIADGKIDNAVIDYAQVGYMDVGTGNFAELFGEKGIIKDLTVTDGHFTGTLDATNVNVANLDAGTLGVTEINGVPMPSGKRLQELLEQLLEAKQQEDGGVTVEPKTSEEIKAEIKALQDIVDNTIETWFYRGVPTANNEPASKWTTNSEKAKHVGDLYYDSATGYAYRYTLNGDTGAFSWTQLKDSDVTKALSDLNDLNEDYQQFKEDLPTTIISEVTADFDKTSGSSSLKGKVSSLITASANEIKQTVGETYATKTSVNGISDRLTTAETSISQQAGQIALKANSTDVYSKDESDSLIVDAKAEIKVTTDGISQEVSKKVGDSEIISKINQSPESVTINANRVNIAGAAIFDQYTKTADLEHPKSMFYKSVNWTGSELDSWAVVGYTSSWSNTAGIAVNKGDTILIEAKCSTANDNWAKGDVVNVYVLADRTTDASTSAHGSVISAIKSPSGTAAFNASEETQYIYISKASGTNTVAANTTWVTTAVDSQNAWTTKRPTYSKSYPVLFVARQSKNVAGTVTCTTPVKDDTTTVIDGGHITTGTIDASVVTVTNINASNIKSGVIDANLITAGTLSADRIGANSITASKLTLTDSTNLITLNALNEKTIIQPTIMDLTAPASATYKHFRINNTASGCYLRPRGRNAFVVGDRIKFSLPIYSPMVGSAVFDFRGWSDPTATTYIDKTFSRNTISSANTWTTVTGELLITEEMAACQEYCFAIFLHAKDPDGNWRAITSWVNGTYATNAWTYWYLGRTDKTPMYARQMASASLIVDGAITADKIAAGSITAAKLDATSIKGTYAMLGNNEIGENSIHTSGKTAYNNSTNGYFLGAGKLGLGTITSATSGAGILWDGSNLSIRCKNLTIGTSTAATSADVSAVDTKAGNAATAASTANTNATNAAKTATNFVELNATRGLLLYDRTKTRAGNVRITTQPAIYMCSGDNNIAAFWSPYLENNASADYSRLQCYGGAGGVYLYSQNASSGTVGVYRGGSTPYNIVNLNGSSKQLNIGHDNTNTVIRPQGRIVPQSDNTLVCGNATYAWQDVQAYAHTKKSSILTKENVHEITEDEARKILDVEAVTFDYKPEHGGLTDQRGVIAEQVAQVIPSVVTNSENLPIDPNGTPGLGVDYSKFVPYLIRMIQIQQEEIDQLREVINGNQ